MMLFTILLVPMVLAISSDLTVNKFIVTIDDNILKSIRTTDELSYDLNLSNLGIHDMAFDKVFENVSHIKSLSLANNSISTLPESAFASLKELTHLSLADNRIYNLEYGMLLGLHNLTSLNISNNPISHLNQGNFYGLSKFTNVITLGNNFDTLNAGVSDVSETFDLPLICAYPWSPEDLYLPNFTIPYLCIRKGIVEKLESFVNGTDLESHCREVTVNYLLKAIDLRQSGISTFSAGWYRLQNYSRFSLDLRHNNIVNITSEILNDLPAEINNVDFSENKIERLVKGSIANAHLSTLNFTGNFISEIEESVFDSTKLTGLILTGNRLKNTFFVATLPSTLTKLRLDENQIDELSPESFSRLKKLRTLTIAKNNVTEVKTGSLRGLTALEELDLTENNMKRIEKGSFRDLKSLKMLNLKRNNLTCLAEGTFNGLESVTVVDLSSNNLTKITNDSLKGLLNLSDLHLSFNQIEILEAATFATVPRSILSLDNNKIKEIENGTFRSYSPNGLYLQINSSSQLGGESLHRSKKLNLTDSNVVSTSEELTVFDSHVGVGYLNSSNNKIVLVNRSNEVSFYPLERPARVNLSDDRIEITAKRPNVTEHSKMLNFTENSAKENSVVGNTELKTLVLTGNRLKNTMFAATLPPSLTELKLDENHINDLSSGSFSQLSSLVTLNVSKNDISEVTSNTLRGLFSLKTLDLKENGIKNIATGSFKDLESLRKLVLKRNKLTYLPEGIFDGLHRVEVLDLNRNKLTEITHGSFRGLLSLEELHLSFNQIKSLKAGTFVDVPNENGTAHSNSPRGLSPLKSLLGERNSEYLVALKDLHYLDLRNNNITEIGKGAVRHLNRLGTIDISRNPIKRLENGALFGLRNTYSTVKLADVPIELIQAGVFDDL